MLSAIDCLLLYRWTLRQALYEKGIFTNPGSTDEEVLKAVCEQMGLTHGPYQRAIERVEKKL